MFLQIRGCRYINNKLRHWKLTTPKYSFHYLYGRGVIITATMAARCTKNRPLPSNNSCSGNTTSGTSGLTESKMHQSYDWWGSNPPLLVVEGRSPSSALSQSAVAEQESSTYLVWRNEKAPLHARESACTNSIWAYVWRMDRHRSESNERQSGVCTKSAKRRFRTQDLRFVER